MNVLHQIENMVVNYGPDVLAALAILIIGLYLAKFAKGLLMQIMQKANYDKTVESFISQTLYYVVVLIVIISALNRLGVPTSSFVAAIGAIGLAIGLALQGNLSNFASGLLILISKPFRAGDFIANGGVEGTVRSIQILNTTVITKDNKTIFIPNSKLTSDHITNYTHMPTRLILFFFDIGYNNDHHKAIRILKEIFAAEPRVLNPENMEIGLREFGENSLRIAACPLVRTTEYWPVYYHIMSEVKDRFDAEGIDIPYPQRVVHLYKEDDEQIDK